MKSNLLPPLTARLTGLLLFTSVLSAHAAFTIGQHSGDPFATIQGQSFTPSDLGLDGGGTAPSPGATITLTSFTFAFNIPTDRHGANLALSIFSDASEAAENNLANALLTSSGFTDSVANDPNFGFASRTYLFTPGATTLDADTQYYARLSNSGNIPSTFGSGTSLYSGGELFRVGPAFPPSTPTYDPGPGGSDAMFYATFAAVPEPGTTLLVSVALLGLARRRR